jgi:uncharacterized protein
MSGTRRRSSLAHTCAVLACAGLAAVASGPLLAVPVDRLFSPRPAHWVLDQTATLSAADVAAIDAVVDAARARTGGEIAVVLIDSTDGRPARDYATELGNRWRLGDQGLDNGVVLLVAKGDRRAEIALGKGIDDGHRALVAQEIMNQEMVPRFKEGDYAAGVVAGVRACAERILDARLATSAPIAPDGERAPVPAPVPVIPDPPAPLPPGAEAPPFARGVVTWVASLLAAGILGFVLLRRPRRCAKCKVKMVLLDEATDDTYLKPAEKLEERLGSVDYKVWVCPACSTVEVDRHGRFLSRYQTCPDCQARTLEVESTTLRYATYDYGGLERFDEKCLSCPYRNSYERQTPPRTRPSADSSRGSSAFASSFAASSSSTSGSESASSSSSGSGGGGGGSFSGGGASGSW